jgi:predicted acylesterase/phospholipase RssA
MKTTKQPLPLLPNGIEKIALSFSGGGFRAASFTLGCSAYLHNLNYLNGRMLDKVAFISSASGGSITAIALCSMLRQGYTFEQIYQHLITQMKGCDLMDEVFKVLNNEQQWLARPDKSRNLINAFAIVYDRDLFKGATFSSLNQKPVKDGPVISEICVNTTEFDNGMNFRFGTGGLTGNKYLHFKADAPSLQAVDKIKLGDILACSSCFPAGFEPVMYPRDFSYQEKNVSLSKKELNAAIFESDHYNGKETVASVQNQEIVFGFMDGGVDDNQGIYGFLKADDRTNGNYDLYFTCDVSSNYLHSPFQYPSAPQLPMFKQTGPQVLSRIKSGVTWYFIITVILLLASVGMLFYPTLKVAGLVLAGAACMSVILPLVAGKLLFSSVKNIVNSLFPPSTAGQPENSWMIIFNRYKDQLLKLPLNQLIPMLFARASSVLLLASTVYLKKIRRISYDYLFSEKANDVYGNLIKENNQQQSANIIDPGKLWKDHIGVTAVYLLATKNDFMLQQIINNTSLQGQVISKSDSRALTEVLYPVSPALRTVADLAASMDTTLWFDPNQVKSHSLENLLATGQASLCFNMIIMAYQFSNDDKEWTLLKENLIGDWERFNKEPLWLVDKYAKS